MSGVTKRKHVMKEMFDDVFDPPTENQQITRIVSSRGNNLHEVEPAGAAENYLVSMPTKFRKNIWVKRGDFVIVEPIIEGDKVKAEIVRILTPQHIKEFTKMGIWPNKFAPREQSDDIQERDDSEEEDGKIFENRNRMNQLDLDVSETTDSEDSEED